MNYETYGGVFNVDLNAGAIPAGKYGIPTILRTGSVPNQLIPFDKAVSSEDHDQWVHFFIHDYQFIRIWRNPWRYLPILAEYNGIISPDFSVFWNYPLYMQLESVCRSREIGAWLQRNGLEVIPCLRWGKPDTYEFAFDGVQPNGTVAVGTLGCVRDRDAQGVRRWVPHNDRSRSPKDGNRLWLHRVTRNGLRAFRGCRDSRLRRCHHLRASRKEVQTWGPVAEGPLLLQVEEDSLITWPILLPGSRSIAKDTSEAKAKAEGTLAILNRRTPPARRRSSLR